MHLAVVIPGAAIPASRARGPNRFTPPRERAYKAMVRDHVEQELEIVCGKEWAQDGPFRVKLGFFFAPKAWNRLGDLDNYGKAVLDACKGLLWIDDKIKYIPDLTLNAHKTHTVSYIFLCVTSLKDTEPPERP